MPDHYVAPASKAATSDDYIVRVQVIDAAGAVETFATVNVAEATVATATVTQVGDSASSVTLQAANTARKGLYVFNDSSSPLKLKYGAAASASSFTVEIGAGGFWEMPTSPVYTGLVAGIWDTDAGGNAYVTEV